ncbi:MAG: signal peptidase I [Candidatus Rokubacteria bacterium]|nr:signal peptidase I [Candidatus Rokubacteria bacterium]
MAASVKALMVEPWDALEVILARRSLTSSAVLGVAGYYTRTLLLSELLFAPLGGPVACLIGNGLVALAWTALVVTLVCVGARVTGPREARWPELFALWGHTQIPSIILSVLALAALLVIPLASWRDLDGGWVLLGIAVAFLLLLWGLLLKLDAVRIWSGRSGGPLVRMLLAAVILYAALAWGERSALVERALVPGPALEAMEPTVTPVVVRRELVTLPFDKLTYLVRAPRRGEIVAHVPAGGERGFWSSIVQRRTRFIGRVIGVPGDTVGVRDGAVVLNGRALDEPYRVGRGHWDVAATTVPAAHYFVLGDNRGVRPGDYQGGLIPFAKLNGRLTELGRTRWEFLVGKGRW